MASSQVKIGLEIHGLRLLSVYILLRLILRTYVVSNDLYSLVMAPILKRLATQVMDVFF